MRCVCMDKNNVYVSSLAPLPPRWQFPRVGGSFAFTTINTTNFSIMRTAHTGKNNGSWAVFLQASESDCNTKQQSDEWSHLKLALALRVELNGRCACSCGYAAVREAVHKGRHDPDSPIREVCVGGWGRTREQKEKSPSTLVNPCRELDAEKFARFYASLRRKNHIARGSLVIAASHEKKLGRRRLISVNWVKISIRIKRVYKHAFSV